MWRAIPFSMLSVLFCNHFSVPDGCREDDDGVGDNNRMNMQFTLKNVDASSSLSNDVPHSWGPSWRTLLLLWFLSSSVRLEILWLNSIAGLLVTRMSQKSVIASLQNRQTVLEDDYKTGHGSNIEIFASLV